MLTLLWKCTWLVTLITAVGSSSAAAQKRATVTVSVELAVPRYRDRFADRSAVQAKAAALFADYLTRNVGFLRFAADDSTRPYRLAFVLDRFERGSTSGFAEVGFWVRLQRPDESPMESYWLQFRSADQSLVRVGGEDEFLNEIKAKLAHRMPIPCEPACSVGSPSAKRDFPTSTRSASCCRSDCSICA